MKTEKLAHWAEIISSLVVVVTLIFLIHEVQRNTEVLQRQSEVERTQALTAPFFEAPELASIMARIKSVDGAEPFPQALVDRYGLSYEEAELWSRHLTSLWFGLDTDFEVLGPDAIDGWVRMLMGSSDNRLLWSVYRAEYGHSEFGAFVDSLAAEIQTDS